MEVVVFDIQRKNFESNSNKSNIISSGTSTVTNNLEHGENTVDMSVSETVEFSNGR